MMKLQQKDIFLKEELTWVETGETAGTQTKRGLTGTAVGVKAGFTPAFALDGARGE